MTKKTKTSSPFRTRYTPKRYLPENNKFQRVREHCGYYSPPYAIGQRVRWHGHEGTITECSPRFDGVFTYSIWTDKGTFATCIVRGDLEPIEPISPCFENFAPLRQFAWVRINSQREHLKTHNGKTGMVLGLVYTSIYVQVDGECKLYSRDELQMCEEDESESGLAQDDKKISAKEGA